ncbi:E2 domain-associated cysteine-rich protein [Rhizobium sophoriradicis]|uniref:E2 domain-associated cysteine-rich protein n=1 Tax=Rhizobium sophoriradicis TaxID=1535245 RepID=UPI003CC938BC
MTLRQRCKCDSANDLRLPLAACGRHARQLADLVLNLDGWQRAENAFYTILRRKSTSAAGRWTTGPLADKQTERTADGKERPAGSL